MGATDLPLHSLIASNNAAIEQLGDVLQRLDDEHYAVTICDIAVSTLGCHVRHVIEHYQSFFEGLDDGLIDYDARARDPRLEQKRDVASQQLTQLKKQMSNMATAEVSSQKTLQVRLQTDCNESPAAITESSVGRELVFLHGHTTHHFAQMALHMRAMGMDIDPEFGMAPSTQRYLHDTQNSQPKSLSA